MISSDEALKIVLSQELKLSIKSVTLEDALGYYLAQEIIADRDFPPFDRVAMDGIAIRYKDYLKGLRNFVVGGIQFAGAKPIVITPEIACIEIMTGASLPHGLDTVIRYEDIEIKDGIASLNSSIKIHRGQNIHVKGMDIKSNTVLASLHEYVNETLIGVAATVGMTSIKVFIPPSIAIISTGDELVPVNQWPKPYQIRRSNTKSMAASLSRFHTEVHDYHIADQKSMLRERLEQILLTNQLIILSGGVSKGKADFVPEVLESLGVKKQFHRISQKPGKPMWFGKTDDGKLVFGLPGNPVSSYLCLQKYVIPLLLSKLTNKVQQPKTVILREKVSLRSSLTFFMQVKVSNEKGRLLAQPIIGNGSGDLFHLSQADGFIEIPSESDDLAAGTSLNFIPIGR